MTAIAAVIALSSTPLFAQVADEPIASTPVIDTTPAPVTVDELAPAPTADTVTTADPLAPAATVAKPAARKATTAKPTAARSRPAPARVASAAPAVAAAPAAALAPADVTPAEPPLPIQPEVAPVEAPVEQPPATAEAIQMDETTMLAAGAGGLALLTLAGAGLAVRRRRRRRLEAEDVAYQDYAEALPEASPEPAMMVEPEPGYMPEQTEPAFVRAFAPAAAAPIIAEATLGEPAEPIDGPTTELPKGFDLSRFGPHVQAAYRGPTEDNPSLSLKYRLRRATAMDQMASKEAAAPVAATAKPAVHQDKVDFMLARSGEKPAARPAVSVNKRPAYSN